MKTQMLSWMLGLGLLGGNGVAAESGVATTSNAPGPERWPVAGQQGAKVGSTVQNPIRLGAVPDVDTFKKTVRRYVAERDANYRIEGFSLVPGRGTHAVFCLFLRNGEGWGEGAFFDARDICRMLDKDPHRAAGIFWKLLDTMVDRDGASSSSAIICAPIPEIAWSCA